MTMLVVQSERYEVRLGAGIGDPVPTKVYFYDFALRADAQQLADFLQQQKDAGVMPDTAPATARWYAEPIPGPSAQKVDSTQDVDTNLGALAGPTVLQLYFVVGPVVPPIAVRALALSVDKIRALRASG